MDKETRQIKHPRPERDTLAVGVSRITNWREAALRLYKHVFGTRCVKCSETVKIPKDGVLYDMAGDLILTHSKPCRAKR